MLTLDDLVVGEVAVLDVVAPIALRDNVRDTLTTPFTHYFAHIRTNSHGAHCGHIY